MLLIILYIHIQTFKYINCIINCSNVSFLYFPHVKLSCIYTYKIWNILNILLTAVLPHIYIFLMFCYCLSCIYTYMLWNILTVFSNIILSYIYIFPCYVTIIIIYTYTFWKVLTVLSTVILSDIYFSLCYITKYPVHTPANFEMY